MINVVIIILLALAVVYAFINSMKHFRGESSCCGGGSTTITLEKKLNGKVLFKKEFSISGMKCKNCASKIQNALNELDGVYSKVDLKKNTAFIKYTKEVPDQLIIDTIKKEGYLVP